MASTTPTVCDGPIEPSGETPGSRAAVIRLANGQRKCEGGWEAALWTAQLVGM